MQPHGIFIRRALAIGGNAPALGDDIAIAQRKDDVGIADINGEQHGPSPGSQRENFTGVDGTRAAIVKLDQQGAIIGEADEDTFRAFIAQPRHDAAADA